MTCKIKKVQEFWDVRKVREVQKVSDVREVLEGPGGSEGPQCLDSVERSKNMYQEIWKVKDV